MRVCDGFEKEDKWSVASEASDFIQQTAHFPKNRVCYK